MQQTEPDSQHIRIQVSFLVVGDSLMCQALQTESDADLAEVEDVTLQYRRLLVLAVIKLLHALSDCLMPLIQEYIIELLGVSLQMPIALGQALEELLINNRQQLALKSTETSSEYDALASSMLIIKRIEEGRLETM
jgi:hypothetical protein